jgi:putative transposase
MCRVLEVSTSGYYAWLKRSPSRRAQEDQVLTREIKRIHNRSKGTYGAPRIHAQLAREGIHVGRKRVARLMRAAELQGVSRRKRYGTTQRQPDARPAPDLVERDFSANGPDELWVADITYVATWSGWLYLAVVVDAWSRRVVGWAMETHLRTQLVLDALIMAIRQRRPEAVIHHSDQGSQYTSLAFGKRCREAGVRPSMGSIGDCFDNALCESFFATLECELLDRETFRSPVEARQAVFAFIESWYNLHRLHSALGYLSPFQFESAYAQVGSSPSPYLSTNTG